MSHRWVVIAFLLAFACLVKGGICANYLALDFALNNETYTWADSLQMSRHLGRQTTLSFENRSAATLIRQTLLGRESDRWQKGARTEVSLQHQVLSPLRMGIQFHQDFDRLEARRFIGNRILISSECDLARWLKVSQKGGVLWEGRESGELKNNQSGFGYQHVIELTPEPGDKIGRVTVEGELNLLPTTPRKNLNIAYSVAHSFSQNSDFNLRAMGGFGEKKYFPSHGNYQVLARQETEQRRLDFFAKTKLPSSVHFSAAALYRYDRYDYSYDSLATDFLRQNDNFNYLFQYDLKLERAVSDWLDLMTKYLFNRTAEDFGSIQTNQRSETGQFEIAVGLKPTGADSISLSASVGITSYFSPSGSTVFSDRDRTIRVASMRVVHRFTPVLTAMMDGSYRGFHTIYISGGLSANNNVNNVFILNPGLIWSPAPWMRITQNYQLHANYIYYDYEKGSLTGRNTIYRRANVTSNLTLSLSSRTDIGLEYGYRYEDFGPLRYTDQWQQQMSWDRRTRRPRFSVQYHPTKQFHFQSYAVYEVQKSFDHLFDIAEPFGRREAREELTRKLIGFELQWSLSPNSYIDCRLERRIQEYQHQQDQRFDVLSINLKRRL